MVTECIFEGEGGGRYDLISVDLMLGIHMPVLVEDTSPRHVHKHFGVFCRSCPMLNAATVQANFCTDSAVPT